MYRHASRVTFPSCQNIASSACNRCHQYLIRREKTKSKNFSLFSVVKSALNLDSWAVVIFFSQLLQLQLVQTKSSAEKIYTKLNTQSSFSNCECRFVFSFLRVPIHVNQISFLFYRSWKFVVLGAVVCCFDHLWLRNSEIRNYAALQESSQLSHISCWIFVARLDCLNYFYAICK